MLLVKPLFTIGLALFPLFGFAQTEIPVVKGENIKFGKISDDINCFDLTECRNPIVGFLTTEANVISGIANIFYREIFIP